MTERPMTDDYFTTRLLVGLKQPVRNILGVNVQVTSWSHVCTDRESGGALTDATVHQFIQFEARDEAQIMTQWRNRDLQS